MGGICGIASFSDALDASEQRVATMCEVIAHRGPDGQGIGSWALANGRVTLGHRLLAVLDTASAGGEPTANEDGTVGVVCDGRIFNHRELRRELEAKGHRFGSDAEAETIVHLYEEEGPRCVERLDGIFAIALWDGRGAGQLLLARDRIGVKPLYYARPPGGCLFASEAKALLAHGAVRPELDEEAFYHYLTFVFTPAPLTMFAGIRKLAPAERVILRVDGTTQSETYWTPLSPRAVEELRGRSEEELEAQLLHLLRRSIRKHATAAVPLGVLLSGGVDSSTVLALMSELGDGPVRTYSVAYEEHERYNELEHARAVARRYGADHREIRIAQADLVELLPQMIFHQDEPLADWVCAPLHYVAQCAHEQGTVVAQMGEGSDEIFHGHDLYIDAWRNQRLLWNPLGRLPRPLRGAIAGAVTGLARRVGRGEVHALEVVEVASGRLPFWGVSPGYRGELKQRVLAHDAPGQPDSYAVVRRLWETAERELPGADLLQKMTYLELQQRVPELLLMRVDKMTMASSVETRTPFLDPELVQFAVALPPRMKMRGRTGKWLLKKAVAGRLLPEQSVYRRKQGFDAPIAEWFRGPFGHVAQRQIRGSGLAERGLIDYEAVDELWAAHRRGPVNWSAHLWVLYNVSAWYDRWVAQRDPAAIA
jgi:asparagine synthase (glutamine-hydrolysing)